MSSLGLGFFNINFLRFGHNMVIHLPIGMIVALAFIVIVSMFDKKKSEFYQFSFHILVYLSTAMVWLAVVSGHITANAAGYQFGQQKWLNENLELGHLILNHRLLGFIEAILLSLMSYGIWRKKLVWLSKPLLTVLISSLALLIVLSHLGASIRNL